MKGKPPARGSVIAALDIGSSKIACFIGRTVDDAGKIEVVGIGHQASAGIKSGTIIDLVAAENAIRSAVHAAEHMAVEIMRGYPLREVIVNVPGVHTLSRSMQVDVQVLGHEVTENDVRRALVKAQDSVISPAHELIHTIPTHYMIDGHEGVQDPQGMYGQNLQVGTHIVSGDLSALKNLATCIDRAYLDVTALCSSPYAAGLASLVDDEMDLGCTVIDMGGGVTSLAVFRGKQMIYTSAVPVGGQHVTSDIAQGLTTSLHAAERLKNLYGSAMATSSDDSELIDVPPLGELDQQMPNHVPRSLLVGIIQPRVEEIFEMLRARLQDSGVGALAGRRVVLTGGASQLPGLRDLAQLVMDKQVRLGRPIRLDGLAEAVSGPAFSTTAGLLTYVTQRSDEMPGEVVSQVEQGSVFDRVKRWLKENW